jgi:hypothetical protein
MEPNDTTSQAAWTYGGGGSLTTAAIVGAVYVGTHSSAFHWAAAPMVVCYGFFSLHLFRGSR